jgi:hypothetical protein
MPFQLKKSGFYKKKVSDCLPIILLQNMKSVSLRGSEEKFVTRYQPKILVRGRRNT